MAHSPLPSPVEAGEYGEYVAEPDCDVADLALLCLQVVLTDATVLPM